MSKGQPNHQPIGLKYIKEQFHINTRYMKVESEDRNFYKGLAINFNIDETQLKSIEMECWVDFKACKFIIKESTKEEYDAAFAKALFFLNSSSIVT